MGDFENYRRNFSLRDRHVIHRKIAHMTKALRGGGTVTGNHRLDKKVL